MKDTTGVIGLGNMGRPIAENLWKAGHPPVVHDIRRQAVAPVVLTLLPSARAPSPWGLRDPARP